MEKPVMIILRNIGGSRIATIPVSMAREYDLEVDDILIPLPNEGDGILRFKALKAEKLEKLIA
ncbi:hypothetical protein QD460_23840 [Rhizobium jaguaris]|uniref:hypothetical protein n=1 Tax=Rhizobium jaguaris TaxID=1312183 RepID=UPI0039BF1C50